MSGPTADDAYDITESRSKGMERNHVTFRSVSKQDEALTIKEGRPMFVPVDYVTVMSPGDKGNVIDRPARPKDKSLYPAAWQAYKNNQDQDAAQGTLLRAWALVDPTAKLSPERIEELAFFKVRTVEALASVNDDNVKQLGMGAMAERERARDYLKASKEMSNISAVRSELKKRDEEIAEMKAMLAKVMDAQSAAAVHATPPRKRGPNKKKAEQPTEAP